MGAVLMAVALVALLPGREGGGGELERRLPQLAFSSANDAVPSHESGSSARDCCKAQHFA